MSLGRRLLLAMLGILVVFLVTWATLKRPAAVLPPPAAASDHR
jgi:hypothetical protein